MGLGVAGIIIARDYGSSPLSLLSTSRLLQGTTGTTGSRVLQGAPVTESINERCSAQRARDPRNPQFMQIAWKNVEKNRFNDVIVLMIVLMWKPMVYYSKMIMM